MKNKITKNTLINEVLEKYPESAVILTGYGLHCVGCSFSGFDTLEGAIKIHGMSKEEFDLMLKDLNTIASEGIKN